MNLSGVVAVSGKSGLYKVLGKTKSGFLLQGLGGDGAKVMVSTNARLAALDETTVYGTGEDLKLKKILLDMQSQASAVDIPDLKADGAVLRDYFVHISPDHDQERVYLSDLKKIISWYRIVENLPIFSEPDPKDTDLVDASDAGTDEPAAGRLPGEEMGANGKESAKEGGKPVKTGTSPSKKRAEGHDRELVNTNLKGGTRNVTHAVRKVNTGANKKAK